MHGSFNSIRIKHPKFMEHAISNVKYHPNFVRAKSRKKGARIFTITDDDISNP